MNSLIRQAIILLIFLTVLTGVLYPLAVTLLAQTLFPRQANGSIIITDGNRIVGSELIGQPFAASRYFWSRPSATTPHPYNGAASTGSNWGPASAELVILVQERAKYLRRVDPQNRAPIPVDLVTSSGSGLDPHISPAAALYQLPRVAKARGVDEQRLRRLILSHIQGRTFGVLGEPVVPVVKLNMALDNMR